MPSNTNPVHMKNGDNYSGYNFIMPSDTKDCVATFTSSDNDATTEKTSDGLTSVATMASGESHASLFQKISKMILNIRKLWNTVGSTAIDTAYGATVTGAINTLGDRFNYSFTEKVVGKWHDGKDLYGRLIDCGTIPSQAAANRLMTSITGVDHCHLQFAYTYGGGTLDSAMMETHIIREASSPTVANIILNTGMDRSAFGKLFVYAEYTKSTT